MYIETPYISFKDLKLFPDWIYISIFLNFQIFIYQFTQVIPQCPILIRLFSRNKEAWRLKSQNIDLGNKFKFC